MTLKEIERELNSLSPAEKLQVLQTLYFSLTDSWPAIERTPGVVGGDAYDDNFPYAVVRELRAQGHDVLTSVGHDVQRGGD